MPFRPDLGFWVPEFAPEGKSAPKQEEIFFLKAPGKMAPAILISGPRETTKTTTAEHKIIRHLWEVPRARFIVVGKTIKNIKEAGVAKDFTEFIIPEWMRGNLLTHDKKDRFRYTSKDSDGNYGPKVDGATKTWYFKIRNYWGGESELLLASLDHDHDIEDKFKNTRFTGMYFPELDRFKDPKVFMVSYHQLRNMKIPYEQLLWIADTNPAEEGPDHFAYKFWYQKDRSMFDGLGIAEDVITQYLDSFILRELYFEDNPWLTPERVAQIKLLYRSDPDLWNRYVLGKWIRVSSTGAFKDVFSRNVHVVGSVASPRKENWDVIVPSENCVELQSGWDMGDVNHGAHIGCKRPCDENDPNKYAYDVLDELVFIKERISIADFTSLMMEKMDYWEKKVRELYGHENILWRHWSDRSAFMYRSASDSMDELIVRNVSEGRIILRSPNIQGRGGVAHRIQLLRRLLFEERIAISAQLNYTIEMLVNANRDDIISGGPYKHPFDSLTYWIAGEEPQSVERRKTATTNRPSRIVTLGAR